MKKLSAALFLFCSALHAAEPVPKNIILFIGDGMGSAQLTAGKIAKGTLEMERCPVAGLVTTWSANRLTTDSAAAATAMATGVKTDNGTLGLSPSGQTLKNVIEYAADQEKSTGLVATCALTHATPAGFAVHVPCRNQFFEIAEQLAGSEIDVLFGGGLGDFQAPDRTSLAQLREKMPVAVTARGFRTLGTPKKAAALLYPKHPPAAAKRSVPLTELTARALDILNQNPNGFFLMVEGSQIDWAGHQNNATNIVHEVIDFDDAVGVGLDFAETDGQTLVIVTADHETGGFALLDGSTENRLLTRTAFVHGEHTAAMVPLFAFGPGSRSFGGLQDNTDIGRMMIRLIQTSAAQTETAGDCIPEQSGRRESHQ